MSMKIREILKLFWNALFNKNSEKAQAVERIMGYPLMAMSQTEFNNLRPAISLPEGFHITCPLWTRFIAIESDVIKEVKVIGQVEIDPLSLAEQIIGEQHEPDRVIMYYRLKLI